MHSPSANVLQIEGKTGRNQADFVPKLTIDNSDVSQRVKTGLIEAVHAAKYSEAATVQHLHDSTVRTAASFEGKTTQWRSP